MISVNAAVLNVAWKALYEKRWLESTYTEKRAGVNEAVG